MLYEYYGIDSPTVLGTQYHREAWATSMVCVITGHSMPHWGLRNVRRIDSLSSCVSERRVDMPTIDRIFWVEAFEYA